jgi:hypothetical protein
MTPRVGAPFAIDGPPVADWKEALRPTSPDFAPPGSRRALQDWDIKHILDQLGVTDPNALRELWADMRGFALPEVKQHVGINWKSNGEPIVLDEDGNEIAWSNDERADVVDIVGGQARWKSSLEGRRLQISMGGGADCMFDYLVSSCFATLAGFTEGQTFTALSGCTFKGYSTVQGMYTAAAGQGHTTAFICGGTYSESPTINLTGGGDRLWVFGAGSRRTVIEGTHTLTDVGAGMFYQNIGFGSASVAYRTTDIFTSGAINPDIDFAHCWLAGRFSCDATTFRFVDCDFNHGFLWRTQATDQVIVNNCTIGDNGINSIEISVGGDFRFEGIQLNSPAVISASTCNGRFVAVKFGTSGGAGNWLQFTNNTAGRWMVDNCQFASPANANGAIYIASISGNFEIAVIGSRFGRNAGSSNPLITSADAAASGIFIGNMFEADSLGNYVEDWAGVSISGSFDDSVFGPNYPSTAQYDITGSNNVFFPVSSAVGSSAPSNTHTLLDGSVHTDTLAGTVVRGDILIGNATPKWARLPIGAAGTVLRSDGTDPAWTALYSLHTYFNAPDANVGDVVAAGDAQGLILHSGPAAETAIKLRVDAETAPGASGLPVTWQYGDTDDLDTVASWTTIATVTLSSEKSTSTTSMTNATIPAARLMRTNYGTIVGTPEDVTTSLEVKRPLST